MLNACEIMTQDIMTINPEAKICDAIDMILTRRVSGLPVVNREGQLIGILTEFALLAIAYDDRVKDEKVKQHMTTDVLTVDAHSPISEAADLCIAHRVRRVPVIDEGKLVGMISRRDVLKAMYQTQAPVCTS